MGHERLGTLPRTKRWHDVVQGIGTYPEGDVRVAEVATATIENVRGRIERIRHDEGVRAVVLFLVGLSVASRQEDPVGCRPWEIDLPKEPTPLSLGLALRKWVNQRSLGGEYSELATQAATDSISQWGMRYKEVQTGLFESVPHPYAGWRKTGRGDGFSELAHFFFSNFTRRYLNYFLEREASSELATIKDRERFDAEVAEHAKETAKIAQSLAAGWFNKYAAQGLPREEEVDGFLNYALGKVKEELLRERDTE
jgi:hypothetical protein